MKHYTMSAALAVALTLTSALTPVYAQGYDNRYDNNQNQYYNNSQQIPNIDTTRSVSDNSQVNFVTGGIGDDERQVIEASRNDYNVHVTSSSMNGAFVEDTQVSIRNKAGDEVLNVNAGPLLYVKLAPGTYTLEATHGDEMKKQRLVIGKKTRDAKVHLGWKVPATVSGDE